MNYYPEQLRSIAAMCEALNGYDKSPDSTGDLALRFATGVSVEDEDGGVYGRLVDEIGGDWSFAPLANAKAAS